MPPTLSTAAPAPADLVAALKQAWRAGGEPDAAGAVRDHPELLAHKSLVIDLAYEEYCLREEAGRPAEPESFCRALPAYRSQVREVIRGHRELAAHPELFAEAAPAWPGPGDEVGGLTVECELGRGAFARAYLAHDPALGCPVVLKLSPAESAEARTIGRVRHPHVVGVQWARWADGLFAVCMPYVGAATLQDAIDRAFPGPPRSAKPILDAIAAAPPTGPAGPAAAPVVRPGQQYATAVAAVGARLAGALAFLHGTGVVHGDLKPSNILLGPGGHPYLIDFNLAALAAGSAWRCGGTLPYMAPERLRLMLGRPGAGGPADRADVYAFGAVLHEALTGAVPYLPAESSDSDAVAADLLARQEASPVRVRRSYPGVPRALARLVDACLRPDMASRPSAAELARGLDRYARRGIRRRRWAVAGLAALVLAVGLTAAAIHLRKGPAGRPWPTTYEGLVERGLDELRGDDPITASKAFTDADGLRPGGRTKAYLGYCESRAGHHQNAVALYRKAIEDGFDPAWVHSDLAYSLRGKNQKSEALQAAKRARDLDPNSRSIKFNWVSVRFLHFSHPQNGRFQDPDRLAVLAALDEVMAEGPVDAELCYEAARVYAAGARDEADLATAVRWLRRAVELGREPDGFDRDPPLAAPLGGRDDFRQLRDAPRGEPVRPLRLRLLQPPG